MVQNSKTMKTLIVYQSKNGTTKKFAEEIAKRVEKATGNVKVQSLENTTSQDIQDCDLLYLGCWTKGRFIFGQKPDEKWIDFSHKMPDVEGKRTVLFTTYSVASGNMFRKMKQHVTPKGYNVIGSMKSTDGKIDYFSIAVLKYSLNYKEAVHERYIRDYAEVS